LTTLVNLLEAPATAETVTVGRGGSLRERTATELCVDARVLQLQGDRSGRDSRLRACLRLYPDFLEARVQQLALLAVAEPRAFLTAVVGPKPERPVERAAIERLLPTGVQGLYASALTTQEASVSEDLALLERVRKRWALEADSVREAKANAFEAESPRLIEALGKARGSELSQLVDRVVGVGGSDPACGMSAATGERFSALLFKLSAAYMSALRSGVPLERSDQLIVDKARLQELFLDMGGVAQDSVTELLSSTGEGAIRAAPLPVLLLRLRVDERIRGISIAEWGRLFRPSTKDPLLAPELRSQRVQFALMTIKVGPKNWNAGTVSRKDLEQWIPIVRAALAPDLRRDLGVTSVVETHLVLGRLLLRLHLLLKGKGASSDEVRDSILAQSAKVRELGRMGSQLQRGASIETEYWKSLGNYDRAVEVWKATVADFRERLARRSADDKDHRGPRSFGAMLLSLAQDALNSKAHDRAQGWITDALHVANDLDFRSQCELRGYASRIFRTNDQLARARAVIDAAAPRGYGVHPGFAEEAFFVAVAANDLDEARRVVEALRKTRKYGSLARRLERRLPK
jgi:hypothetical protein